MHVIFPACFISSVPRWVDAAATRGIYPSLGLVADAKGNVRTDVWGEMCISAEPVSCRTVVRRRVRRSRGLVGLESQACLFFLCRCLQEVHPMGLSFLSLFVPTAVLTACAASIPTTDITSKEGGGSDRSAALK